MCRDHRLNDFSGHDHHEWEVKRELAEDARALAAEGKTKVIAVFNGLFLEGAFRVRLKPPLRTTVGTLTRMLAARIGSPALR